MLLLAYKHIREHGLQEAELALSANALLGGDCVHRGSLLGALLGAAGVSFGSGSGEAYDYEGRLRLGAADFHSTEGEAAGGVDGSQELRLGERLSSFVALVGGEHGQARSMKLTLAPKPTVAMVNTSS